MHKHILIFTIVFLFLEACSGQSDTSLSDTRPIVEPLAITQNIEGEKAEPQQFFQETEQIRTNDLLGKITPSTHPDFAEIPSNMANRGGMWMHRSALAAFLKMSKKAKADGITLTVISATRTFDQQKRIWERKWTGAKKVEGQDLSRAISDKALRAKKILEYSSMPGTSRHHWGTDIDINSLNNDYFSSGKGKREFEWLRDNAFEFGFCQPYSQKGEDRPNGYEMEKWHWSYFPLAKEYLFWYQKKIKAENLNNYKGSDALPFTEVLKYVQGISLDCQ